MNRAKYGRTPQLLGDTDTDTRSHPVQSPSFFKHTHDDTITVTASLANRSDPAAKTISTPSTCPDPDRSRTQLSAQRVATTPLCPMRRQVRGRGSVPAVQIRHVRAPTDGSRPMRPPPPVPSHWIFLPRHLRFFPSTRRKKRRVGGGKGDRGTVRSTCLPLCPSPPSSARAAC